MFDSLATVFTAVCVLSWATLVHVTHVRKTDMDRARGIKTNVLWI